eukprot:CAMPEP_0197036650 /NCGR_PEP_ID=MMETSP1384-20130603/14099_1 /TAXON_ID=29189 /ORGANISM="Ammonia sp." /LENGTH=686 /DNA_ID=CAMNT_0042466847 /DNA_START=638 /DNA_END=2698 /DNA_ORIENTATION=-
MNPSLFNSTPYDGATGHVAVSDVYIGLQRANGTNDALWNFTWTDSSAFDFGSNVSVGEHPWIAGNPSNDGGCVSLNVWGNLTWNDYQCTVDMRFLCNECVGQMNKYILIKQALNWTDALSFCREIVGTDLASMHSEDDYQDVKALCQLNGRCRIGLNDIVTEGTFVWSDGSSLDFGHNTSGGVYPWFPGEPNNSGGREDTGELLANGWKWPWNDMPIDVERRFVCNAPSELCATSHWSYSGDLYWSGSSCDIHSESQSQSILHHKHWISDDAVWRIDYLFTLHAVQNNNGESGVVVYHFDSLCDYYYAGIQVDNAGNVYMFLDQYYQTTSTRLSSSSSPAFVYEFNRFYTFRVELDYSSLSAIQWQLSVFTATETFVLSYTDSTLTASDFSDRKYVGLKNTDTNISGKSLFISDSATFDSMTSVFAPDLCTRAPTMDPTIAPSAPTGNPSISPTATTSDPSVSPTENPSVEPTIHPSDLPSTDPTGLPTVEPTVNPSLFPTASPNPALILIIPDTENPSVSPTSAPFATSTTNNGSGEIVSQEKKDQTMLILIVAVCVLSAVIIVGVIGVCVYAYVRKKNDLKTKVEHTRAEMAVQNMQSRSMSHQESARNMKRTASGAGMVDHDVVDVVNRTHGGGTDEDTDIVKSVDETFGNAVDERQDGEDDHETPDQESQDAEFETAGNTRE